jgi:hypothetical protein
MTRVYKKGKGKMSRNKKIRKTRKGGGGTETPTMTHDEALKTFGEGIFDLSKSPVPGSPASSPPPVSPPPDASPDASLFSPQPRAGDPFTEGVGVMPRWEHLEREASLNESVRAEQTALLAAQKAIDDAAAKVSLGAEEKARRVQQATQQADTALTVTKKLYSDRVTAHNKRLPKFTSELDRLDLLEPEAIRAAKRPKGGLKSKKRKHRS